MYPYANHGAGIFTYIYLQNWAIYIIDGDKMLAIVFQHQGAYGV